MSFLECVLLIFIMVALQGVSACVFGYAITKKTLKMADNMVNGVTGCDQSEDEKISELDRYGLMVKHNNIIVFHSSFEELKMRLNMMQGEIDLGHDVTLIIGDRYN